MYTVKYEEVVLSPNGSRVVYERAESIPKDLLDAVYDEIKRRGSGVIDVHNRIIKIRSIDECETSCSARLKQKNLECMGYSRCA